MVYETGANELLIFDLSNKQAPAIQQRINLPSAVQHVSVAPDQSYMLVMTQDNMLYSYLLPSLILSDSFNHVKAPVSKLKAMNDAAILLEANGQVVNTLTVQQGLGSPRQSCGADTDGFTDSCRQCQSCRCQ